LTGSVITCPALDQPGLSHAFFTRNGGISTGLYASLNGGTGSRDDPQAVSENRRRMATHLGVAPQALLVPYQIHSADVVVATQPWAADTRPRADGLVTNVPHLALGVTGADCGMILFADAQARVIGACHAGWKGAFTGILEATLAAMERLGGARNKIVAVLGPTIAQSSYEVGPEFVAHFVEADAETARLFVPSNRPGHALFDLPAFIGMRLTRAGVGSFHDLALDTYADEERFFSYRRSTHRAEADYGRLVSAIALA
jgi:YfiH family protein